MRIGDLQKIVLYIVRESIKLKDLYTSTPEAKTEFCDIFSKSKNEFTQLTRVMTNNGKVVYPGPTGSIYFLNKPINTACGDLYYVKIRKPDKKVHLRGDADFDTNYKKLLEKHKNDSNFEHIVREKFEMLRLSDPDFDVMTCFSNIPVRKWI